MREHAVAYSILVCTPDQFLANTTEPAPIGILSPTSLRLTSSVHHILRVPAQAAMTFRRRKSTWLSPSHESAWFPHNLNAFSFTVPRNKCLRYCLIIFLRITFISRPQHVYKP
ncbi:hypothetical protein N7G274_005652 [Stereocaulon virgatum]|uniref:Uncharacterized protein n=1 Tax=Stereocaulon virgatum TaxID=373712 RepID=A0ABR4ABK0_9LECA